MKNGQQHNAYRVMLSVTVLPTITPVDLPISNIIKKIRVNNSAPPTEKGNKNTE